MIITTRGIIFRHIKYSESSLIGDIYTEEVGLRSFIISGVSSKKSKSKLGILQPASLVEVTMYHKDKDALNRIKEVRPDHVYKNLPFELNRSALAIFMLEICRKSIREHETNVPLFEFLHEWFIYIDQTRQSMALVHILFMMELSHLLGFGPSDLWSENNNMFDLKEGVFTEERPDHPYFLNEQSSHHLHLLFHLDRQNIHELKIPKSQRNLLLGQLINYYALHVEGFGSLKSVEILQEIFQ